MHAEGGDCKSKQHAADEQHIINKLMAHTKA
jgi:hypothetical protein